MICDIHTSLSNEDETAFVQLWLTETIVTVLYILHTDNMIPIYIHYTIYIYNNFLRINITITHYYL